MFNIIQVTRVQCSGSQFLLIIKFLLYRELSQKASDTSGKVHTWVPDDTYLAVNHMAHGYS